MWPRKKKENVRSKSPTLMYWLSSPSSSFMFHVYIQFSLQFTAAALSTFFISSPPCDLLFQASRNGATGVELDLSFTADGVPVLMHDETVDRTTNGSGPIGKLQIVQLRRLDAAAHHRLKYASCQTVTSTLLKLGISCSDEENNVSKKKIYLIDNVWGSSCKEVWVAEK